MEELFPPPGSKVPTINKCCQAIPTNPNDILSRFSKADPYSTGYKDSWKFTKVVTPKDFRYIRPKKLGSNSTIRYNMSYNIPPKYDHETDDAYKKRRVQDFEAKTGQRLTFAGEGSMSWAYYVHGETPSDHALKDIYKDLDPEVLIRKFPRLPLRLALRMHWITENSNEVVKLRKPSPWGNGMKTAIKAARTDLAIQNIYKICADNFKEIDESGKEKAIIHAVPFVGSPKEISQGIFRQPTIQGPTAAELADRLDKVLNNHDKSEERYLIQVLGFKNLKEVQKKLGLLESFYVETHNDILMFRDANDLEILGARAPNGEIMTTGFDFNHGQNVIWNVKTKIFEAIDF